MVSYQSESMDKANQIINITKKKKKTTPHNREREVWRRVESNEWPMFNQWIAEY